MTTALDASAVSISCRNTSCSSSMRRAPPTAGPAATQQHEHDGRTLQRRGDLVVELLTDADRARVEEELAFDQLAQLARDIDGYQATVLTAVADEHHVRGL